MATKSILKSVSVKKPYAAKKLIRAMEAAERHQGEIVKISRTVNHVAKDKIKEFFGDD